MKGIRRHEMKKRGIEKLSEKALMDHLSDDRVSDSIEKIQTQLREAHAQWRWWTIKPEQQNQGKGNICERHLCASRIGYR
jgi:hypothetical protein